MVSADPNGDSYTTSSDGYYELLVDYGWSGTVTPTKASYKFKPPQRTYSNVITNQLVQDYMDITTYDLDDDGFIGWGDVSEICDNWLIPSPAEGDFNGDGTVNFEDFAEFALAW